MLRKVNKDYRKHIARQLRTQYVDSLRALNRDLKGQSRSL